MVQYLSEEWLVKAGDAIAADDTLKSASADTDLVIQYEVTGTPQGKSSYGIVFQDGASGVEPGPHKDAPVSFALDYDTAVEIAKGELSAQAAFMQGRMKLGGDVTVLIRQHALVDGLGDALKSLREVTEF